MIPEQQERPEIVLGARDAFRTRYTATLIVNLKFTRRYVWIMKLRHIWAIICADWTYHDE